MRLALRIAIVAAVYYLSTLISPRMDVRVGLRGAVVLYLVVAGLIWNVYLTELSRDGIHLPGSPIRWPIWHWRWRYSTTRALLGAAMLAVGCALAIAGRVAVTARIHARRG